MNNYAITFDIDWAPDFAIRDAAEMMIKKNIKCTWFITHESQYVKELFKHTDLFEFGIHPNFFPGSSHGATDKDVMDHITTIVPASGIARSHILYQSTSLLEMMHEKFGVNVDCNLLLYLSPGIIPHRLFFQKQSQGLLRIPYFWEDDLHMLRPDAQWDVTSDVYHAEGLKIFNFHPMHTYLNSSTLESYNSAKELKPVDEFSESELKTFVNMNDRPGIRNFFNDLINYFDENNISTYKISGLKNEYEKVIAG